MSENSIAYPEHEEVRVSILLHPSLFENEIHEDDLVEPRQRLRAELARVAFVQDRVIYGRSHPRMLTPEQAREEGVTDTGYGALVMVATTITWAAYRELTEWRQRAYTPPAPRPWHWRARMRIKAWLFGHRQSVVNKMIRGQK